MGPVGFEPTTCGLKGTSSGRQIAVSASGILQAKRRSDKAQRAGQSYFDKIWIVALCALPCLLVFTRPRTSSHRARLP
jgi:hypothetical protein